MGIRYLQSTDQAIPARKVNTLEWPAAAFPTGLMVDPALDKKPTSFQAANETEEQLYSICT